MWTELWGALRAAGLRDECAGGSPVFFSSLEDSCFFFCVVSCVSCGFMWILVVFLAVVSGCF